MFFTSQPRKRFLAYAVDKVDVGYIVMMEWSRTVGFPGMLTSETSGPAFWKTADEASSDAETLARASRGVSPAGE